MSLAWDILTHIYPFKELKAKETDKVTINVNRHMIVIFSHVLAKARVEFFHFF